MGGAETSLLQLLASVKAAQPEWALSLLLGADGPLVRRAKALGVSVRVVPMPGALARLGDSRAESPAAMLPGLLAAIGYVRRIRQVIRAEQPQLIHSTGFKMHVLSAWACPRRIPLIWHIHDYVQSRPVMSRLLRWHARWCAAAIANSQSVATDVFTALAGKVRVDCIYNAIDLVRFSPVGPRADLDALSGLPAATEETIRIGLVATFAWWKGHRVFLKALSRLPSEVPIRGYIIGGPLYQTVGSQESLKALHTEAVRLGLTDRVGFTGHVDDPSSAMRALDVVVHASTAPEPFGMVIVEGMACGKPVVVSNAGGAHELFEEGVDGLGHPSGNVDELTRNILRLADDRTLRARLGSAGRRRAEAAYATDRLGRDVCDAYERLGIFARIRPSAVAAGAGHSTGSGTWMS